MWKNRCYLVQFRSKIQATPDRIVLDEHSMTHFPSQPWRKVCEESRVRDSPHREQADCSRRGATTSERPRLHGKRRPSTDCLFPRGNRHFFWSHLYDKGARLQEDGHALRGCWNSQIGAVTNASVYTKTKEKFNSCCCTKRHGNAVSKDETGKFYDKCHRHRAVRAVALGSHEIQRAQRDTHDTIREIS